MRTRIKARRRQPLCMVVALFGLAGTGTLPAQPLDAVSPVLQSILAEGRHPTLPTLDVLRHRAELIDTYGPAATLLWTRTGQATPQAIAAMAQLRAAENLGLRAADYAASDLAYLAVQLTQGSPADSARLAQFDIGLTAALFAYLNDAHFGRVDPRTAGLDLQVERSRLDLKELVSRLSRSEDPRALLRDVEPAFHHYELLKSALQRYRELAQQPQLTRLPPPAASPVRPGDFYAGAAQLRALLIALGDLPARLNPPGDSEITRLDPELADGLKRFQVRHGLAADGILGQESFRALTVPLKDRVQQIELTLERWRWLPPKLASPPIIVNLPQFRLFAFHTTEDLEDQLLSMDVIIGKTFAAQQTPVFAADMTYLVLRPYWDVPYSITTRELLPAIRSDPGYLQANQLEIVAGAGDAAKPLPASPENLAALATGALRLRQRPGPGNALGPVKFMLPNRHNVYLHGTPAQGLFARPSRALSHGCIRVADPLTLAEYVLRDDPNWNRERIAQAMQQPQPTQINLKQRLRVFIVYGTAIATENGRVLFFADVYGHDARLAALLARRR